MCKIVLTKNYVKWFLSQVQAQLSTTLDDSLPTCFSSSPCMTVILLLYLLVEHIASGVGEDDINVVVTPSHYLKV